MRKTIHVEGIPGSGKTTAATQLCELLRNKGVDAHWYLEESVDHPIMPDHRRALSGKSGFPQICMNAWQEFLNASDRTVVLDGYAFQSTVRFLYANLVEQKVIEEYFQQWQALSPNTTVVFFVVEDPYTHFEVVFSERGADWTGKLFDYVENTPMGVTNNFHGKSGFVEFWSRYQQLCRELLDTAHVPVALLNARSWTEADLEDLAISCELLS